MIVFKHFLRAVLLTAIAMSVSSCDPQVYGSIGMSSWGGGGYGGSPRVGGSISIGGCLTCR